MGNTAGKRLQGLQGLRGMAFILIFISHCFFLSPRVGYFGAYGVSLFIVMSGFLAMIKSGGKEGRNEVGILTHFMRKISKLYSLHIAMLILALPFSIYAVLNGTKTILHLCLEVVLNLLLVQSFVPDKSIYFSLNSVSWYLSLVLLFVLTEPFLVKYVKRIERLMCVGGLCIAILVIEYVCTYVLRSSVLVHWAIYINPFFRILDFLLGMTVGVIYLQRRESSSTPARKENIVLLFGCLVFVIFSAIFLYVTCFCNSCNPLFMVLTWAPVSAMAVYCAANTHLLRSLYMRMCFENKALVVLGNMSLELFLIHQIVIRYWLSLGFFSGYPWLSMICCFGISICGALIWKKIISWVHDRKGFLLIQKTL